MFVYAGSCPQVAELCQAQASICQQTSMLNEQAAEQGILASGSASAFRGDLIHRLQLLSEAGQGHLQAALLAAGRLLEHRQHAQAVMSPSPEGRALEAAYQERLAAWHAYKVALHTLEEAGR